MERLGLACPHVRFVPAEIGHDDLDVALARAGHDAGHPTLWICEGIAPYLPADVLAGLLSSLARRSAPRSQLVLELALVPTSQESRTRREQLNSAVTERGEPLRSAVEREQLDGLLAACGWLVRHASDPTGGPLATSPHSAAFIVAAASVPQAAAPGGFPAYL
jgi:methyltransferase (TIGR00027 family)